MNNYTNMNYYTPNVQPQNNMPEQMLPNFQNTGNQGQNQNQGQIKVNPVLKQKLDKQAGDNMNFNKCDYNQQVNSNNVYDIYGGFIRGNMFPDLYNGYKLKQPFDIKPMNEQAELLTYIDAYSFAAHDLNLYLDNNPTDRDMIELFKQYTDKNNQVMAEYENKYGPLFVDATATYPWAWNNSPWPWENK